MSRQYYENDPTSTRRFNGPDFSGLAETLWDYKLPIIMTAGAVVAGYASLQAFGEVQHVIAAPDIILKDIAHLAQAATDLPRVAHDVVTQVSHVAGSANEAVTNAVGEAGNLLNQAATAAAKAWSPNATPEAVATAIPTPEAAAQVSEPMGPPAPTYAQTFEMAKTTLLNHVGETKAHAEGALKWGAVALTTLMLDSIVGAATAVRLVNLTKEMRANQSSTYRY